MILSPATMWMLDASVAPALRYMQDQRIVQPADLLYAAPFVTRVAARIQATGLSRRQVEVIEKIIARRGWEEPARWRPWAEVIKDRGVDVYRITACPGASERASIDALARLKPPDMRGEISIGPLYETTRDPDDPRLEPTPAERRAGKRAVHTTICRRLVAEAASRGLLIDGPS